MRCALKSSLFRLFRTKLFFWIFVFSLAVGLGVFFNLCTDELDMYYSLSRPRYFDTEHLILCLRNLIFVFPFGSAVFCMMFTGSDISSRTVNNKIVTGTPRIALFFADVIVSVLATVLSVVAYSAVLFIMLKFVPIKEAVEINSKVIQTVLHAAVISIAFTVFFTLLQFLFSNKLFGVIISMFLVPALMTYPSFAVRILAEPYRYSYKDEDTGEIVWELNPEYISGNERKALTFSVEINPYYEVLIREPDSTKTAVAAGAVIMLSAAAGVVSVSRKEFP